MAVNLFVLRAVNLLRYHGARAIAAATMGPLTAERKMIAGTEDYPTAGSYPALRRRGYGVC